MKQKILTVLAALSLLFCVVLQGCYENEYPEYYGGGYSYGYPYGYGYPASAYEPWYYGHPWYGWHHWDADDWHGWGHEHEGWEHGGWGRADGGGGVRSFAHSGHGEGHHHRG